MFRLASDAAAKFLKDCSRMMTTKTQQKKEKNQIEFRRLSFCYDTTTTIWGREEQEMKRKYVQYIQIPYTQPNKYKTETGNDLPLAVIK